MREWFEAGRGETLRAGYGYGGPVTRPRTPPLYACGAAAAGGESSRSVSCRFSTAAWLMTMSASACTMAAEIAEMWCSKKDVVEPRAVP